MNHKFNDFLNKLFFEDKDGTYEQQMLDLFRDIRLGILFVVILLGISILK